MTTDEADRVLAKMTATWSQKELTEPEEGEWHETLRPLSYEAAIDSVRGLRAAFDWLPTHHQFVVVAQDLTRRQAAGRALQAPAAPVERCELCGATGWREIPVDRPGYGAVERCQCSTGKSVNSGLDESTEHPARCTCHVCPARKMRGARALRKVIDVGGGAVPQPSTEEMF